MLVCSARGAELERAFPFGVVRQLAASSFADTTAEERDAWFCGVAKMAAPLFGEDGLAHGTAGAGYAQLHALYWLCANAARRRPLALVIDDAHWSDESSLAFLGFLARRVGDLPLLLALGARPSEPGEARELVGLLADPDTTALAPDALTRQGVTLLLREILGADPDPVFAGACHEVTGGNPFLLTELAAEIGAQRIAPSAAAAGRVSSLTPAGVRTTALLRLARLGVPARRLARTLALLGDHTALPVAAELTGLEESAAIAAAAELEEAGITWSDDGLGYVHPLLRSAVHNDIPAVERSVGHAAAARVLVRRGAAPDEVSVHLLRAEPSGEQWVVETLRDGAGRALALGDPQTGAAYLRRALAEPAGESERPRLLLELGVAETRSGDPAAVVRLAEAADAAVDAVTRCEATLRLAQLLNLTGDASRAADVLEEGIAALVGGPPKLAELLQAELIATAYTRLSSRERLDQLIRSLREPDGLPTTPLELYSTAALAVEYAIARCDPARGAELARRVLASPNHAPEAFADGQIQVPVVVALIAAEQLREAEDAVTESLEAARREASVLGVAVASSRRAAIRLSRDDLLGAEADASASLELLAAEPGTEAITMGAAAAIVLAGVELGRARGDLDRVLTARRGDPDYPIYSLVLLADGALRAVSDDFEGALASFEECGTFGWLRDCPALCPWRSRAALALARLGRAAEAREHAAEELRLARAAATPRSLGVALQATAAVARDDREREARIEEAVAALERADAPLELARALLARGALRRRTRRRSLAREDLQRAHDLAAPRGASRLAAGAADELRSSGARLRSPSAGGADDLTPAERRVAELAATGLTNRDIAQSLFLSEKTVEAHLGRTYRKLGIRSRGRLAAALGLTAVVGIGASVLPPRP
jgi:DNA-binding NarL/FixJ family response regulator